MVDLSQSLINKCSTDYPSTIHDPFKISRHICHICLFAIDCFIKQGRELSNLLPCACSWSRSPASCWGRLGRCKHYQILLLYSLYGLPIYQKSRLMSRSKWTDEIIFLTIIYLIFIGSSSITLVLLKDKLDFPMLLFELINKCKFFVQFIIFQRLRDPVYQQIDELKQTSWSTCEAKEKDRGRLLSQPSSFILSSRTSIKQDELEF